jgi:GH35 family endo-1,4-beta-xylanase
MFTIQVGLIPDDRVEECDRHASLEPYVTGVLSRFKNDKRVHGWDLFNEPDNPNTSAYGKIEAENKAEIALSFLKKVYDWARKVDPSQPLTMGVWIGNWGDPARTRSVNDYYGVAI